jgi:hypothetical protein
MDLMGHLVQVVLLEHQEQADLLDHQVHRVQVELVDPQEQVVHLV